MNKENYPAGFTKCSQKIPEQKPKAGIVLPAQKVKQMPLIINLTN